MLSRIFIRIIPMLMIFVSATFAAAPGWVAKGVVLDYSMDGDTVTFTVTERTSTEVKYEIKTTEVHRATENASLEYGQFWFDSSMLAKASKGGKVGNFSVTDKSSQTFAGKQWNTVTLKGRISGAETTRIYDQDSGLMLKQTVQVSGAPVVTLSKYTVPNFGAAAPPPPAQPQANATQNTTQPVQQPTQPAVTSQPAPQPEPEQEQAVIASHGTSADEEPEEEPEPSDESTAKPCYATAILLTLLGLVFVRN